MEIFIILISFFGAAIIFLFIKNRKLIEFLSVLVSAVVLFESINIVTKVVQNKVYSPNSLFLIDSLGAIVVLIISFTGIAATVYSIAYLREESSRQIIGFTRVKQYFILLNLFLAAMFLAVSSNNPVITWISVEATTLSTAFLISFYNKPSAMEAAWKYLIINSIGLLLGFFGTLLYLTSLRASGQMGFITWNNLLLNASHLNPIIAKISFIFVLIGYGTKVGLAPMHTWKPDAYSKAPAPIGALFSGALLSVAFLVIMKFKVITDSVVGPLFSQKLFIIFGVLSISVASFVLYSAKSYKRLLAYSSIEHAGIMMLGFGFGGLGIVAATLNIIYHSLVKSTLFFLSGNILLKYRSDKIVNIKGMINVLPITAILFLLNFLIITGIPPFGIFINEILILSEGIKLYPFLTVFVVLLLALLFVGFLKYVTAMVYGKKSPEIIVGEKNIWLLIPPLFLVAITLYLTFHLPQFLKTLLMAVELYY